MMAFVCCAMQHTIPGGFQACTQLMLCYVTRGVCRLRDCETFSALRASGGTGCAPSACVWGDVSGGACCVCECAACLLAKCQPQAGCVLDLVV